MKFVFLLFALSLTLFACSAKSKSEYESTSGSKSSESKSDSESKSNSGTKSTSRSSSSCSWEDEIENDISNVYIITAKDAKDLDRVLDRLHHSEDCEGAIVKSIINNLMFAATVRISRNCAEEVDDWGYAIEPNALQFTESWMPDRCDQRDLPLDNSYTPLSGGEGVTIFVLDTGINTDHSEFEGRAEFYYDVLNEDQANAEQGDLNGHGTNVASAAIGKTIGLANKANVKSIRVAGPSGSGTTEHSGKAYNKVMEWAVEHPDDKCVVCYAMTAMTISGHLDDGVKRLSDYCTVVVSAGNFGQNVSTADACRYSPGRASQVITVGASRLRSKSSEDDKAGFSCTGSCVDIYAPGHKTELASYSDQSGTVISSGTSFAAAAVAGAAAALLDNGVPMPNIKYILQETATRGKLKSVPTDSNNLLLNIQHELYHGTQWSDWDGSF